MRPRPGWLWSVSARADLRALDVPTPWDAELLASAVLERYGRQHDDALAVVVMLRRDAD